MTTLFRPTVLALAMLAAFPVAAQTSEEVLKELKALRDRVTELEKQLKDSKPAGAAPGQWGMTPEQARELNRIGVKAEALEDARDASGLRLLTISGYMDPTFIYNKAQDRAGFQFLNAVGDDGYNYDNSYFGAAVIDFQKEMESGTRWRLTLAPNRGVGAVFDGQSPVHEATVSVPLTDLQTRFIAGQMPDWSGYEYLQPTLNKLITHNLLFDFTLPTAYTGAGLDYTSGKWWLRGMVANMNASRRTSGNKAPVFAYRVDYSRGEFQGFGFAGVHGKAANFNTDPATGEQAADSRLDLFEFDAYFIRGDVTAQAQISFGSQKRAAIAPDPVTGDLRDSSWVGLSMLGAYKFDPRLEGTVRADYLKNNKNGGGLLGYTGYWDPANGSLGDNRNGIGVDPTQDCVTDPTIDACNKGANRMALTFGVSYLWDLNTTFKVEYRIDRANLPVFAYVKDGTFKKSNQMFGASVLVAF
jgi:hypothetical protein